MNTNENYNLSFWGKVPKKGMIVEWELHELFDYQIAMVRSHIKKVIGEKGIACRVTLEGVSQPGI